MIGLERKLEQMSERLKEISKEIEHARKQEIAMKQSSGEYVHFQSTHIARPPDDRSLYLLTYLQSQHRPAYSGSAFCLSSYWSLLACGK